MEYLKVSVTFKKYEIYCHILTTELLSEFSQQHFEKIS